MQFFLEDYNGKLEFALKLAMEIKQKCPVFVCIGSDRVVSDMIAPLIAEFLVKNKIKAYVYGRLHNPIYSKNLASAMQYILQKHKDKQIIIIDAGVGEVGDIGSIKCCRGGIIPAGIFNGSTTCYGDVSIMPIVGTIGVNEKTFLRCARFQLVYELAKNISSCISNALNIYEVITTNAF